MRARAVRRRATGFALAILGSITPAQAVIVPGPQGAALADPSDWSSILLFTTGAAYCSTTVVGPQVILIAADCVVSLRGEVTVSVPAAAGRLDYRMTCTTDPRYPVIAAADLALCRTDRPLPVTRIERLAATVPQAGAALTLVGYGCRDAATRNFDGSLSAGQAVVQVRAQGQAADGTASTVGAAACKGDGGGGAFLGDDSTSRVLVGVISRTDVASRTTIALVATEAFVRWATQWSQDAAAAICGLSNDSPTACTARPQEAPAMDSSGELPRGGLLLARPTSAASVVASTQLGRANSNEVPLRQVFYRKGEVLAAVVQISCYGTADDAYLNRVLAHLERTGQPLGPDHVFPTLGTLTVPVCPPSTGAASETVVAPVTKGGSKRLWDYFQQLAADKKLGERWLFEYREQDGPRVTPPGRGSRYFVDVFKELNPAQDPKALTIGSITLPLRPKTVTVSDEPAANIDTLEPFAAVSVEENCSRRQNELTYPYDLTELLATLAGNARAREGAAPEAARIVILDSGLYTGRREDTVFRRVLYVDRAGTTSAAKTEFLSRIEPRLPQATKAAHGTQVASVALGGPLFARFQASVAAPRGFASIPTDSTNRGAEPSSCRPTSFRTYSET